ncbi:MAG: winged helix DNA-binding protein [Verrucomicrobia bacterium]|nr:winged helix DNA-binding protein [Verrucomicrobiota bacterium]
MSPSPSSFPEQARTLGALLRLPYHRLSKRLYAEMAASGFGEIRPSHSVVFRHLSPEGSRLTDLAEVSGLTKQSMAYLVEYLAKHDYVTVAADPVDRRAKRVLLTKRGHVFMKALLAASSRLEDELGKKIGRTKLQNLRTALADLDEAIMTLPK